MICEALMKMGCACIVEEVEGKDLPLGYDQDLMALMDGDVEEAEEEEKEEK